VVPVLETIDSIEELRAAADDPEALLERVLGLETGFCLIFQPVNEDSSADAKLLPSPSEHVHKRVLDGLTVAEEREQEKAAAQISNKTGHRLATTDGQDTRQSQTASVISLGEIDSQLEPAAARENRQNHQFAGAGAQRKERQEEAQSELKKRVQSEPIPQGVLADAFKKLESSEEKIELEAIVFDV
jgi:hypothetical protein